MTNVEDILLLPDVLKNSTLQDPQLRTLQSNITGNRLEDNIIFEHYEKGSFSRNRDYFNKCYDIETDRNLG